MQLNNCNCHSGSGSEKVVQHTYSNQSPTFTCRESLFGLKNSVFQMHSIQTCCAAKKVIIMQPLKAWKGFRCYTLVRKLLTLFEFSQQLPRTLINSLSVLHGHRSDPALICAGMRIYHHIKKQLSFRWIITTPLRATIS